MAYFTGRKWHGWSKGWNFLIFHILQSMGGDFLHLTNTGSFYKIPGFSSSHLSLFFFNSLVSTICYILIFLTLQLHITLSHHLNSVTDWVTFFPFEFFLCSFQVVMIRNCWIACYILLYRRELPAFLWTSLMLLI